MAPELCDTQGTWRPPQPWLASQLFQNSQQMQMKTKRPDVSKHWMYSRRAEERKGGNMSLFPVARDIRHHSQHVQPLLPVYDTPLFEMTIALIRKNRIQKFHQNS